MFSLFKNIFSTPVQPIYRIPENQRVYAVGDIHGRADLLEKLQHCIIDDAASAPPAENLVIYLGDYIDRGMDIRDTLDLLQTGLPDDFQIVRLRGNHEELLLRFLEDSAHLEAWLAMGGQATLMSYQVAAPGNGFGANRAAETQAALREALPPEHWRLLNQLQTRFDAGDYFFTHAGVRPGVALNRQRAEDLLWIREDFLDSSANYGARVVHGHSIVRRPDIQSNRIGLDTGAYATGVLSCAVLEGDQVRLLKATAWQRR